MKRVGRRMGEGSSWCWCGMILCFSQEEKRKQLTEEMEEAATKARRRSLGNIRFIGELFKLKVSIPPPPPPPSCLRL